MRKSTVTDHEKTNTHVKASQAVKASTSSKVEVSQSVAGRAMQKIKSADKQRVTYLMRNAHAVAKQNRPLTDYTWLAKLDKAKGLEIGHTYLNEKGALRFIECIADTTRKSIHDLLKAAPFFSFVMDGSTDISGDEQESMYVRTVLNGKIYMKFLAIGTPASTCSNDLYEHVLATFKETGVDAYVAAGVKISY